MEYTPLSSLGSTVVYHWGSRVDANNYVALLSDGTNLIARKCYGGGISDATIAWARPANVLAKLGARFDTTTGVAVWLNGTKGA